jgi:hypothetical protein
MRFPAWLLALAALSAQADDAAQKVLDCVRTNIPPAMRVRELELTAYDRAGGMRTLKGKLYAMREKELVRAMLRISAPSDLADAAYLVRENTSGQDEMYIYLPAVARVRRINGSSIDGSLLGTDISYGELKQIENAFQAGEAKLEGQEQIDQHPVSVLLIHPSPAQNSRYTSIRAWIDQKSCVALKAEFFEGQTARKELTIPAAAIQPAGKAWYFTQAQLRDLHEGTRTELKLSGYLPDTSVPGRLFDTHSFYLGN